MQWSVDVVTAIAVGAKSKRERIEGLEMKEVFENESIKHVMRILVSPNCLKRMLTNPCIRLNDHSENNGCSLERFQFEKQNLNSAVTYHSITFPYNL